MKTERFSKPELVSVVVNGARISEGSNLPFTQFCFSYQHLVLGRQDLFTVVVTGAVSPSLQCISEDSNSVNIQYWDEALLVLELFTVLVI